MNMITNGNHDNNGHFIDIDISMNVSIDFNINDSNICSNCNDNDKGYDKVIKMISTMKNIYKNREHCKLRHYAFIDYTKKITRDKPKR